VGDRALGIEKLAASENESGVTLTIPMTFAGSKSPLLRPDQLSAGSQLDEVMGLAIPEALH